MSKVKFISYDGEYPNLCSGTLVLDINGEVVTFSEYCMHSGGCCGFSGDYTEEYVEQGEWTVDVPEKYKQYEDEINEVVNENVRWGCCGGCL